MALEVQFDLFCYCYQFVANLTELIKISYSYKLNCRKIKFKIAKQLNFLLKSNSLFVYTFFGNLWDFAFCDNIILEIFTFNYYLYYYQLNYSNYLKILQNSILFIQLSLSFFILCFAVNNLKNYAICLK